MFVIVGDFAGQLCPIADRWKDAAEQNSTQDSDLMHGLVKGLQIHLRTCRRCAEDVPHVQLTQSLYGKAFCKLGEPINKELFAEELRTTVAKLRPKFPMPQESLADVILTVSHYTRINVNAKAE